MGQGGWEGEGCFAKKPKSIYWLDFQILTFFALSNLTTAVKILAERKRWINFNWRFATFWLHYICVFAWLWLCLTENFLLVLNLLGHTATPETAFPTLFEKIIVAMAENCENCLLSCDWRWLAICGHICSEQWICRCTSWYVPSCFSLIAIISHWHVFQGSKWSGRQALSNKRGKTERKTKKENETR